MVHFRQATAEDIKAIVNLVESAYRGESSRQGWTTEADLIDGQRTDAGEVSTIISTSNNYIILSVENQQLQASVHIINKGKFAYLGMFAVSPEAQGKGIGKALLVHIENKIISDWQCEFIEMSVITQRVELINWYIKRGYIITGEKRDFPYGDERYGIPKRDDLSLDVLKKIL